MNSEVGAKIERGVVEEVTNEGYIIRSTTREGIVTPALPAINGAAYRMGDLVYFFMFADGKGAIMAAG